MRKLSYRLAKPLGQGHRTAKWLSQDLNSGSINPQQVFKTVQTTVASAKDII